VLLQTLRIRRSAIQALGFVLSHRDHSSLRQKKQWPQAMANGTTDAVPNTKILNLTADLDDLTHKLMAENIALFHCRNVSAIDMEV
jgi:hypothetical protein